MTKLRSVVCVQLPDCLPRSIDRKLGYMGDARLVFFYYEPRGEEVVWNDGRSYGFGCGGWLVFGDEVTPLARRYGIDLGSDDRSGEHALMIDRRTSQAFFLSRTDAEAVVAAQNAPSPPTASWQDTTTLQQQWPSGQTDNRPMIRVPPSDE